MTAPRVLRYDDLEPTPWRNGQGVTRTLRAMSDGGGWALSIATIEGPAAFSVIPSTQRVQLAIDAVRLEIDGDEVRLNSGEQVRFTGEQRVTGASAAMSSRVLNLMYADGGPELRLVVARTVPQIPRAAEAVVVLAGSLETGDETLGPLDSVLFSGSPDHSRDFAGRGVFAVVLPRS
ncbi:MULTISPECIES: HutD family protein [unclassified Pseudoclavibacter]|uniref:HutD family protein n=1 Tax=unclassified Pseudoclavibacter TaxID=2615177 RepID=UPI001BA967AF|nr:HutD family protein [Pseudoclavibacter sp. Marseille-Q4354]MBS3177787.1 HutD family protein [Pseudoclavibacter sp. Marseille-Q4354]